MSYMLTKNEYKTAKAWQTYQGYTVRPVPSTIDYYKKIIAKLNRNDQCMIYGSTPEIRSLFQANQQPLFIMDRSMLMVRSMGLLTQAGVPIAGNEQVLENDWLSHGQTNRFDMLIGDDAINMLSWSQFETFLASSQALLKPNGLFVCHLLVKPDDEYIHQSVDEVHMAFESSRIKNVYDLASRLNFICYDEKTYQMGWQNTIKQLGHAQLAKFKPHFDFAKQFKACNSQFVCPPQACFEDLLEPYFTINEIIYPHEHDYCQFEPIYVLKKKEAV